MAFPLIGQSPQSKGRHWSQDTSFVALRPSKKRVHAKLRARMECQVIVSEFQKSSLRLVAPQWPECPCLFRVYLSHSSVRLHIHSSQASEPFAEASQCTESVGRSRWAACGFPHMTPSLCPRSFLNTVRWGIGIWPLTLALHVDRELW